MLSVENVGSVIACAATPLRLGSCEKTNATAVLSSDVSPGSRWNTTNPGISCDVLNLAASFAALVDSAEAGTYAELSFF